MDIPISRSDVLLCFAVKEEAIPARNLSPNIVITGIGSTNARRAIERALQEGNPKIVLTCGFAGGLDPKLGSGDVLFHTDDQPALSLALKNAGARDGRFHFASRIASTAKEKRHLWEVTGADAIEMESKTIQDVCQSRGVPCATVRVISDAADQDLPFDFNRFMDADQNLKLGKLLVALVRSPGKVPSLIKLQRTTRKAAIRLANVLNAVIRQ